ncbi:MAG: hypothetical protein GXY32_03815 [Ruminococcaceae bacterium]|nr:hypothetical protein [Oscillospiraceae bacterium]
MTANGFVPARKKWVWIGLAALVAAVLLFAMALRTTTRSATGLNPAAYTEETPEGFHYAVTASAAGGALTVTGWACIEGERMLTVDNWVVLYDPARDTYLRLPTTAEVNEAPTALINDGLVYGRAGLTAIVPVSQLEVPLSRYELCFAYASNGHNALIHTGEFLAGEGIL